MKWPGKTAPVRSANASSAPSISPRRFFPLRRSKSRASPSRVSTSPPVRRAGETRPRICLRRKELARLRGPLPRRPQRTLQVHPQRVCRPAPHPARGRRAKRHLRRADAAPRKRRTLSGTTDPFPDTASRRGTLRPPPRSARLKNLAADERYAPLLKAMRAALADWEAKDRGHEARGRTHSRRVRPPHRTSHPGPHPAPPSKAEMAAAKLAAAKAAEPPQRRPPPEKPRKILTNPQTDPRSR